MTILELHLEAQSLKRPNSLFNAAIYFEICCISLLILKKQIYVTKNNTLSAYYVNLSMID